MTAPVMLPPRLDSAAAIQLARDLREKDGGDLVLDAAAVELVGAMALQTLAVAAQAWRAAGRRFAVVNLSEEARAQLATLGLSDLSLLEGAAP